MAIRSRSESGTREAKSTRLQLGTRVRCLDGPLGKLDDVVIDPTVKRVTHLVVQPLHQQGRARLVPIELVKTGSARDEILLGCTMEDVRRLPPMHDLAYLRLSESHVDDPDWDLGVKEVFAMPYYNASGSSTPTPGFSPDVAVLYDRIPKGEVEVRRSSTVVSADGDEVGRVEGFLVEEGQITHLVLERGHVWGRREVTIPIGAVRRVGTDTVVIRLTKAELGELPSVPVIRWRR